jgi:protein-arginine kinase activator protein McsA
MNGISRAIPGNIRQIAIELCDLLQQQFDTLQRGLNEEEMERYFEIREQINSLRGKLEDLCPRPS